VLHEVTEDGGLGFCQPVLPSLLPPAYHGPLVVALDSNVLIDLQQHGAVLLNGESLPEKVVVDVGYVGELTAVTDLLNLWLMTDAKQLTERFLERREASIDALADSLAFQFGDWSTPAPSQGPSPASVGDETGLPPGPDRDLVLEAQAVGAHVFLTQDREVLRKTTLSGPPLAVLPPSVLAAELAAVGVELFGGGTCGGEGCPYGDWSLPAPDMGKWSGLLSILE
jgi:hypothetical protein